MSSLLRRDAYQKGLLPTCLVVTSSRWGQTAWLRLVQRAATEVPVACLIIFDLANWCWMILAMFPWKKTSRCFNGNVLFFLQADVSSLRTSQRCLQSELLKLRAQNAKEIWASSYVEATAGSSLKLLLFVCFALWCRGRKFHSRNSWKLSIYNRCGVASPMLGCVHPWFQSLLACPLARWNHCPQECAQMADLTTYVDENEKLLNANRELSTSLCHGNVRFDEEICKVCDLRWSPYKIGRESRKGNEWDE